MSEGAAGRASGRAWRFSMLILLDHVPTHQVHNFTPRTHQLEDRWRVQGDVYIKGI